MKDVCLELKVCEACGALHLRAANQGTNGALHPRAANQKSSSALHPRSTNQGNSSGAAAHRSAATKSAYCPGCEQWLADCPLPARSQGRYGRGLRRPQAIAAVRCAGGAR